MENALGIVLKFVFYACFDYEVCVHVLKFFLCFLVVCM